MNKIVSAKVNNQLIDERLLLVATMNYGQFERWTAFVPLEYEFTVQLEVLVNEFDQWFSWWRSEEIQDDYEDVEFDEFFPEIADYKKLGHPTLQQLVLHHVPLAKDILKYHEYELLHSVLCDHSSAPQSNFCYSVNSISDIQIQTDSITVKGICFQSDYLEHTYNYKLPTKYALLKPTNFITKIKQLWSKL